MSNASQDRKKDFFLNSCQNNEFIPVECSWIWTHNQKRKADLYGQNSTPLCQARLPAGVVLPIELAFYTLHWTSLYRNTLSIFIFLSSENFSKAVVLIVFYDCLLKITTVREVALDWIAFLLTKTNKKNKISILSSSILISKKICMYIRYFAHFKWREHNELQKPSFFCEPMPRFYSVPFLSCSNSRSEKVHMVTT